MDITPILLTILEQFKIYFLLYIIILIFILTINNIIYICVFNCVNLNFWMKDNEDIDRIKVDPSEAYKRFKDEIVNSDNIDFSDKLGRSLKTGYKSV